MTTPRFTSRTESIAGGEVAHVNLRGDKSLNLVDGDSLRAMNDSLQALCARPGLRAVFLRGASEKAFIGGANLHVLGNLERDTAEPFIRSIHDFCSTIRRAPVPIVAVLQGYCLGAGLEIAAACDMRIGDASVRCGMPEVRVGVPSVVEAALLPGLVGWGKARELMLRGHVIEAAECLRIGLLQHVVEGATLDALVTAISEDFVAAGPVAIAAQKALFLEWEEAPVSGAIERGVHALVRAYEGDEPARMAAAFFDRRTAS